MEAAMIERNGFGEMADFDITCDKCGEESNFDTDGDFFQAIADAKRNGWKVTKQNGQWQHFCPECANNANQ